MEKVNYRYFSIFKPFGMLSQFGREGDHPTLADLNTTLPKDVYPIGRLDHDSEGLLLLSNDPRLNNRLLDPKYSHWRSYLVQVEGDINNDALSALEKGIEISINGKVHRTAPAKVKRVVDPIVPERNPPIRFRKSVPDSWIELSLTEGKNRQVRRMTAKSGFPTLRLIRIRIEKLELEGLQPGEVKEWDAKTFFEKLNLRL